MPMPGSYGSFNAASSGGNTMSGGGTSSSLGGGSNPYFNPQNSYGGDRSYQNTPAVTGPSGYLEQNPQALFTRFTSNFAGGDDPFSQYVRSQQQRIWDAYQAAVANNMNLTRQQFLGGINPQDLRNQFLMLSPFQRGRNDALFSGPLRVISNG